jgi:hypothetical protein
MQEPQISHNAYAVLLGKPEWKRPLRRPRHRCDDNIKTDLREIGLEGVDWSLLTQNKNGWQVLVNTAMNLQVM